MPHDGQGMPVKNLNMQPISDNNKNAKSKMKIKTILKLFLIKSTVILGLLPYNPLRFPH